MYDNPLMYIKVLLAEAHTIKPNTLLSVTVVKLLTHSLYLSGLVVGIF